MTFDREDFVKAAADARWKARIAAMPSLALLEQAEVSADNLTHDPHWDLFLRVLQAAIEKTTAQADDCVRQLANPSVVNEDDLRLIRQRLLLLNERIACWTSVISLPKQIHDEAGEAMDLVAKLMPEGQ